MSLESRFSRRGAVLGGIGAWLGWFGLRQRPAGAASTAGLHLTVRFSGRDGAYPFGGADGEALRPGGDVVLTRLDIDLDAAERVALTDGCRTIWGPHLLPAGLTQVRLGDFADGGAGGVLRLAAGAAPAIHLHYGSHGVADLFAACDEGHG